MTHAHRPSHPLHARRTGPGRGARRTLRRWLGVPIALLIMLGLPWQGLSQAIERVVAPAHFHTAHAHGHEHERAHAHEHADEHAHEHAGGLAIGHHAHDLQDDDVVYIAAEHDPHAPSSGGTSSAAVDLALQPCALDVPAAALAGPVVAAAASCRFGSQVVEPLKRPPR